MSIDKTLKRRGRLQRIRSVLSRDERIAIMKDDDRFVAGQSPFGLPKQRIIRMVVGKKKKKKTAEEGADGDKKKAAKKK